MAIDKFSTLYKISMILISGDQVINVSAGDIVSIAIICNYDTMTHPVIRVRLYPDISVVRTVASDPSKLSIRCNLDGGIYRMNSDDKNPVLVSPAKGFSFKLKAYMESKNIPASNMDNYIDGTKKSSDLNTDIKVPLELYCYNETLMHDLKRRVDSIYTNMSVQSVVENIFSRNGITNCSIDTFHNQEKWKQVLIPNLNISDSIQFLESNYGLYKKGAQFFCDVDHPYLCNSDVNNSIVPIPIYVESSKNNDSTNGMQKLHGDYYMTTMAQNVSVLSETDIERVMNAKTAVAVNVKDLSVESTTMSTLFGSDNTDNDIPTPNILHKTANKYITSTYNARVSEKTTSVDISGSGFDISKLKINTRYNLVFASPIRGANIGHYYRATFACHVLSNMDGELFIASSSFNLRSN